MNYYKAVSTQYVSIWHAKNRFKNRINRAVYNDRVK